ncbi:MAG: hypothetical protein IPJ18_07120 [Betaproteobacteria bacterium]|nr:hypothetical protein [Betaproteobacteria bacterium]
MSIEDSNTALDANGYWSHPKPNWEDWNRKNKCKLWEAVLLACNVDPAIYGLHGLTADFEADSYLTPVPADVRSLLSYVKIAVVNVDLRPVKRDPSNLMQSEIDMADFTAWLRTQGHQTPDGYPWIASELIPGKYQWPWGTYQTKDLELLAKAAGMMKTTIPPIIPQPQRTKQLSTGLFNKVCLSESRNCRKHLARMKICSLCRAEAI